MVVIVLTACPAGLRGYLTRWLIEISAGVFTGTVNVRVRELLWLKTVELVKNGRAIMVYSARNEQGLKFKVHRHDWTPVDVDGVTLMMRPASAHDPGATSATANVRPGWSNQSRWRRARRSSARRSDADSAPEGP
jgi:CRISPR-associated protein Cas2